MLFPAGAPGTVLPVQLGRGCWLDPSYKSRFQALLSAETKVCLENIGKLLKRKAFRSPFQKDFSFCMFTINLKINILCSRKSLVNAGMKTETKDSLESPFSQISLCQVVLLFVL